MVQSVETQGAMAAAKGMVSPGSHWMLWLAGGLIAAGIFVPIKIAATGFLVAGAALATVVLVSWVLARHSHAPGSTRSVEGLDQLIAHDERAILLANDAGEVLSKNSAARARFGDAGGRVLERVFESTFANANAIIFRLQAKAERINAAREDVVTRNGRFLIAVHKVNQTTYLWAVEELQERTSSTRTADKISLPMMTASASGTILFMNDAMRRLVGGRVKSLEKMFTEVPTQSGQIVSVKVEDGPLAARVIIVEGSGGRTEYFLAPSNEEAHPKLGSTLDTLEEFPVALLKIDPSGQVLEANKLSRRLLRIASDGALDKVVLSDLVEGLGKQLSDWLTEAAEGRSLHKPEILKARNAEDEVYLQITLGRVIEAGEVFLMAMVTDATELKTLEAQFVQSQKMQAIGQLAGGVAHDFNNLLTAISGHCDLLMLRHDAGDPDFGDLEQINQNANRAASLVGQLLAFSRKQNLQLEVLDMRDTLADLTHLLNRLVGAQISLSLTHDPELMSVHADRRQLEQVIMNLVVNARDALDGGGEISIETRNLKLQEDVRRDQAVVPRGDYVLVKVSDTGCGIPADKMSKIFEPFFTTKRTGEGTGLGLSTAYGIVKQSGGFIFVDSAEGSGTAFTIYFPSYNKPAVTEQKPVAESIAVDAGVGEGVVLLVEDEAPVRAFASRALKLRGYQVLEAESAEDALSLLKDDDLSVDIVVTDVVMPGLDGPTWVKEARKTRPEMRVVFVSGYAEDNFAEDQAHIPNSVFLPKPFSLNALTATVRGQLGKAA
ncbi:MAG: ATP-binding protein [Pseudomonadota bacterium]